MRISEIGKNLFELVKKNSHDFSPYYNLYEKDFLKEFNAMNGIKNDVRINTKDKNDYDSIRISLLTSDFTSVFPYHTSKYLYTFDPEANDRKIIGEHKYLEKIINEIPGANLYPGYGSVSEELIEETFNDFYPLIECNKLLIRPEKIVFSANLESGKVMVHPADANGEANEWKVNKDNSNSLLLIDKYRAINNAKKLSEILIPYISGISIKEYSKIILDEEDLLSSFRLQLKNYLKIVESNNINALEFRNDVIDPKLDLINRKFKVITNNHRLKVAGATIGTSTLMLLSISQLGIAAALSQFIGFGLGTVGFLKTETDYHENIDKLKDIPEYLLWKIKNHRK